MQKSKKTRFGSFSRNGSRLKTSAIILLIFLSIPVFLPCFCNVSTNSNGYKISGISSISNSVENDTREGWWNSRWHKRMFFSVDAGNFDQYSGIPFEYAAPFDEATLDPNSIRLVKNGKEIPCEYDAVEKKVIFVENESLAKNSSSHYTIYYDVIGNGVKETTTYDTNWVQEYNPESITNGSTLESLDDKYKEWLDIMGIYEENGSYFYNGTSVVFDNATQQWRYYNGTNLEYYFTIDFLQAGTIPCRPTGQGAGFMRSFGKLYTLRNWTEWEYLDGTPFSESIIGIHLNITFFNSTKVMYYVYYRGYERIFWVYDSEKALLAKLGDGIIFDNPFFMGASLGGMTPQAAETFATGESGKVDDWEAGAVRAKGSVYTDYYSPTEQKWLRQYVKMKAYKGCPTVEYSTHSNVSGSKELVWGSALFDLNGSIYLNNSFMTAANASEFYENLTGEGISGIRGLSNIKIITQDNKKIDVNNLDWSDNNTFDLTAHYGTHTKSGNADQLLVKPYLLTSRYLGFYDTSTGQGVAITLPNAMAFNRFLIEIWREEKNGSFYYYLNSSINWFDWWFTTIDPLDMDTSFYYLYLKYLEMNHTIQDSSFDFSISYLGKSDPDKFLDDLIAVYDGERNIASLRFKAKDSPIPINIIVHKPKEGEVFERKEDIEINVTVFGETLANVYYKFGHGVQVKLLGTVKFWENTVSKGHYATNGSVDVYSGTSGLENFTEGALNITVGAEDTNSSIVYKCVSVFVEPPTTEDYTWLGIGIGAGAISAVSVVIVAAFVSKNARKKRKKIGRKTDGCPTGDGKISPERRTTRARIHREPEKPGKRQERTRQHRGSPRSS